MNERSASPFNPKTVLALVLAGACAFFAALYFTATGQTGSTNDGGGHAAASGINGYAALAAMLEAGGHDVTLSRSPGAMDDYALLVLTPPLDMDAAELQEAVENRRYQGPTIIVLPKWQAAPIPPQWQVKKAPGWVVLGSAMTPRWSEALTEDLNFAIALQSLAKVKSTQPRPDWQGMGLSGQLPDRSQSMSVFASQIVTLVRNSADETIVGYVDDDGYYPTLAEAAGFDPGAYEDRDADRWGVIVVAEPDLMNNYGMADRDRALLASRIITLAMQGKDLPIVFDLTQSGLGGAKNLLTLAFTPPFLAATICMMLAMLVIGWRAFHRFGPPVAESRAIAFGKRQLVANSASLMQRTGRLHLLSAPYALMMQHRVADALGLRHPDLAEIDAALARRLGDEPQFSQLIAQLRDARTQIQVLRAAAALKSLERKLSR
ncbi:DUF4350 domain-containing protein [Altererythrobacter confluentis]|uniref:DUF4350 domain-containing protein n=1 Tax=Allopontixanthobacter confluentis TaxID=1849021 RepID=A0A6L7GI41_9SPHN|nr:DUF4350 domain-containing protein [Allopontixanthobacter confluentis]MXP15599.1 DUF4350 domain-containing protein [Allopontixanthobacter confluentis]